MMNMVPDLDEFRLDKFIVNNEKLRPFLRGEGEREGKFFHLQTWRREGLIARIRLAGFNVRTLQDRIDALRAAPLDVTLGEERLRVLGSEREQIAAWDSERLRWRDLPPQTVDGVRGVLVRIGEALRRRRSRGGGEYFIATPEQKTRAGLRPVRERDAILHAYGVLAASGTPAVIRFRRDPGGYYVPSAQALLPEPHRDTLDRLATDGVPPWTFDREHSDMVEQVFEKLTVRLEPFDVAE
jgi:hypothetical protein